jgi:pyruvate/2-oxoglutarate dehydrogenase complex dihydrolipoamide dehydrogenase (E3) component
MQKKFDALILGAGTEGLSALKEVRRHTKDVLMIDPGPLGSTCARVGCMPSKAFVQIAHDIFQRDMKINRGHDASIRDRGEQLDSNFDGNSQHVDAVMAAMGRRPNLDDLDLEQTGCERDEHGEPLMDESSHALRGLPTYMAGDVDMKRQLLHEAFGEGRMAGYHACHPTLEEGLRTALPGCRASA